MAATPELSAAIRARSPAPIAELCARPLGPFAPNLVARPWAGRRLAPEGGIGESFEISADPDDVEAAAHPSMLALADGSTLALAELIEAAGAAALGEGPLLAHGRRFPLLPKRLDIGSLLSIQAHPVGFTEAYVILDADRGATIRVGWREDVDADELRREIASALARPDDRDAIARMSARMLDRLNEIEVRPGMVIHNADPLRVAERRAREPTAQIHALGDPHGRSVLMLEVRRPGPTYRLWDHGRLPARELDVERALACADLGALDPAEIVVEPHEVDEGVWRSVQARAFTLDHLRPRAGQGVAAIAGAGVHTLHALAGTVTLVDRRGQAIARLQTGESLFVPADAEPYGVASDDLAAEVVRVTLPSDRPIAPSVASARARLDNLGEIREIVASSTGPRTLLAVVGDGDGPATRAALADAAPRAFRADGTTGILVHEERTRRGQLFGALDAVRAHADRLARDEVVVGLMLPGKGTRASPLTHRAWGIKPMLPVPVRSRADDSWLGAATASAWSWTLVARHLHRMGFRGLAWKWGDEPQIPARPLSTLELDLSGVDAVRFAATSPPTDELARAKEWLVVDRTSGLLVLQLRRRPLAELRARARGDLLVHLGSPALSWTFLAAAEAVFGGLEGALDVDGWLFESLTHDDEAWAREVERDAGLRALLAEHPDFRQRTRELSDRIAHERGHPLRIAIVDLGDEPGWLDVGTPPRARAAWAALAATGAAGDLARALAAIEASTDRWGNRLIGRCEVPDDGSVRDCVLVDAELHGDSIARGCVVVGSTLGDCVLAEGAVVFEAAVDHLRVGAGGLAFRSIAREVSVPGGWVHTSILADPDRPAAGLEDWWADGHRDLGARGIYDVPQHGNPASFLDKLSQVRNRGASSTIAAIEREITARFRAPLVDAIRRRRRP